jgi:hypothetical protein
MSYEKISKLKSSINDAISEIVLISQSAMRKSLFVYLKTESLKEDQVSITISEDCEEILEIKLSAIVGEAIKEAKKYLLTREGEVSLEELDAISKSLMTQSKRIEKFLSKHKKEFDKEKTF